MTARNPPRRIAAIDVGATSVRMRIVERDGAGGRTTLEEVIHPIALGADTFRINRVTPGTLRALGEVMLNFRQLLREYDVSTWRAIGTSAIRDATNRDIVIDRLQHTAGIRVRVLEPVEESRITYRALLPFLRERGTSPRRHSLILDLGGGSTEIMVLKGERIVLGGSSRLGVARLLYGLGNEEHAQAEDLLETTIRNAVHTTHDAIRSFPIRECIVVNSVIGKALMRDASPDGPSSAVSVTPGAVTRALTSIRELSFEEISARFGLTLTEAEHVRPALLILRSVLDITRARQVYCPEVDVLAGLADDVEIEIAGGSPQESFHAEIVSSASGIGDKFSFDRAHAEQVRTIALSLFETMRAFFDLRDDDRLLLELASLLHDVGRFVHERDHHKHSMYLVRWSEIVGLGEHDRDMVALISRYHRKGRPKPDHPEYAALPLEDRLRVSKLASILRIADAMDRSHTQRITEVSAKLTDAALEIDARARGDLSIEESAVEKKANLFEDLTGLPTRLRRTMA